MTAPTAVWVSVVLAPRAMMSPSASIPRLPLGAARPSTVTVTPASKTALPVTAAWRAENAPPNTLRSPPTVMSVADQLPPRTVRSERNWKVETVDCGRSKTASPSTVPLPASAPPECAVTEPIGVEALALSVPPASVNGNG